MIDARVILKCSHSEGNSVPLMGEVDDSIFKVYFLDVGLVNAIMGLDFQSIDHEMKNNFNTKGMIAEQFVAQHLAYLHNERRGPEFKKVKSISSFKEKMTSSRLRLKRLLSGI